MWTKYNIVHPAVAALLSDKLKFHQPTDIQREVFENYKHYYDFLLASQTGSGKTLAFAIPIVSELLNLKQEGVLEQPNPLSCLILTPTRELALQIEQHIKAINVEDKLLITNIIGGLSRQKQLRLLSYRPDIVIATPGRLHELLSEEGAVLNLQRLRFLVIDEADRMIEMGHFREVDSILDKVFDEKKETFDKELQDMKNHSEHAGDKPSLYIKDKRLDLSNVLDSMETDKLVELPADFFKIIDATAPPKKQKKKEKLKQKEEEHQKAINKATGKPSKPKIVEPAVEKEPEVKLPRPKKRIFLVSATLTREFKGSKYFTKKDRHEEQLLKKDQKDKKGKHGNKGQHANQLVGEESDLTPKLKALVSRIQFTSKPKIIDLSSMFFLPEHLTQYVSYCEEELDRLVHLVCYLENMKKLNLTAKILIFTNTIKASKLVSQTLTLLEYPNLVLHSNMQQRQRLSKMDRFTSGKVNTIICTDLAARGLDMLVDIVVQFGVPLNGDTYVHRLGRTARAGRSGESFILVSKKEYSKWKDILSVLSKGTSEEKVQHKTYQFSVDQLEQTKQKVELAEKARVNNRRVDLDDSKKWLVKQAKDADIILDNQLFPQVNDESDQPITRKIQKLKLPKPQDKQQQELLKWKRNKMVLSPTDIQAYLKQLQRK